MKIALTILLACVLASGCVKQKTAGVDPGPYLLARNPSSSTPMQHRERLIAMDQSAADALFYVNHNQGRLPSGQVKVQVNLQNRDASHDIWMDWKIVFYDAQNFEIESTEWNKTFFPAKEVKAIQANSIRPDVQNFTVILRKPSSASGQSYQVQEEYVQ